MPTYKVGTEPLKPRKSMREVLCEGCGKSLGKALFTRAFAGLSAGEAIELWPYLKVDIRVHETNCPSSKESSRPIDAAVP